MLVGNISSSDNINKDSASFAKRISKIRLMREPKLYYVRNKRGRSGRGLAKFREITELFIDKTTNHVFVGYKTKDRTSLFYQYSIVGSLVPEEEIG